MRFKTSELHRGNLGQAITIDILDEVTDSESYVMGQLEAIRRYQDRITLTVGGTDYDFRLTDTVDMARTSLSSQLARVLNIMEKEGTPTGPPLTGYSAGKMLEAALRPGSALREDLQDLVREVIQEEFEEDEA